MSLHKEIHLETEICEHLAANGWLTSQGDTANYDRTRALFPADVIAWVQATQPKAWDTLEKNHGAQAADVLLGRLRDSINQRGTLDVLRHGIEMIGLRQPLALDLGLFLNGIPAATAELKTDFTQSVDDAIDQYRFDREPRPKG